GFTDFTSHALHPEGAIGSAVDLYLRKTASAKLTIEAGVLTDGNQHQVYSPPQGDPKVVLFEDTVDLGPAVLQRQMIKTTDAAGATLYGLREIFTAKPEGAMNNSADTRPAGATTFFHLNNKQVNLLLFLLVLLDIVLSLVTTL